MTQGTVQMCATGWRVVVDAGATARVKSAADADESASLLVTCRKFGCEQLQGSVHKCLSDNIRMQTSGHAVGLSSRGSCRSCDDVSAAREHCAVSAADPCGDAAAAAPYVRLVSVVIWAFSLTESSSDCSSCFCSALTCASSASTSAYAHSRIRAEDLHDYAGRARRGRQTGGGGDPRVGRDPTCTLSN